MSDSPPADRNIVLLTVDSLRADYCYSADVPTPALDDLTDSGTRFETAIAPGPATNESMPVIFTGTQPGPSKHLGGVNRREHIATHLRAHRPIPARLRERGYATSERGDLCVRGPWWKYYAESDGIERLYDLRADPGEREGVAVDDALPGRYRTALNEFASLETATRNGISTRRL